MKAAFLGRLVGALVVGVGARALVALRLGPGARGFGGLLGADPRRTDRAPAQPEETPVGEALAIGLGLIGFAFLVIEFFGFLFSQIAASVTPPPPPDDLPSFRDENF